MTHKPFLDTPDNSTLTFESLAKHNKTESSPVLITRVFSSNMMFVHLKRAHGLSNTIIE